MYEADQLEQIIAASGQACMDQECEVAGLPAVVRVITWSRLQEEAGRSPIYQKLIELIEAGLPEDRTHWP